MRSRLARILHGLAALGVVVALSAGFLLSYWLSVPPEPLAISPHFIDLVQAGDLSEAYLLTAQRGAVGASLAEFDAKIRHELSVDSFPTPSPPSR